MSAFFDVSALFEVFVFKMWNLQTCHQSETSNRSCNMEAELENIDIDIMMEDIFRDISVLFPEDQENLEDLPLEDFHVVQAVGAPMMEDIFQEIPFIFAEDQPNLEFDLQTEDVHVTEAIDAPENVAEEVIAIDVGEDNLEYDVTLATSEEQYTDRSTLKKHQLLTRNDNRHPCGQCNY